MKHDVYITRQVKNLGHNNAAALVKKAVSAALAGERINCECSLSVLFTDDEGIRAINREFRATDTPTDVLSFPMDELRPPSDDEEPPLGLLGDIVLCPTVTAAQAAENGRTPESEADYLLVHGLLHLLGYDHAEPAEKKVMFDLNDRLVAAWDASRS